MSVNFTKNQFCEIKLDLKVHFLTVLVFSISRMVLFLMLI